MSQKPMGGGLAGADRTARLANGAAAALGSVLIEGPFVGEASLALVNREIAQALMEAGVNVTVLPAEPRAEVAAALRATPLWPRVIEANAAQERYDLHLRNAWPTVTHAMRGRRNGLVCWAWEETDLPAAIAERFSRDLDVILTTADFVSAALRRSGVTAQIHTIGNGADHVVRFPQAPAAPVAAGVRRLLHVSTCLPRKAPDVLVEAFARSFRGRSDVELYIKTTWNPHNQIESLAAAARARYPDAARIVVNTDAIGAAEMLALYKSATGLVLASRGEGFGLPLAEAMMLGVPAIACRHGAQADFCSEATAVLVESAPAQAVSHVASGYALWEEPDTDSLGKAMRLVVDEPARARVLAQTARAQIQKSHSWAAVARRAIAALSAEPDAPAKAAAQPFELVSTWNEACGIATYTKQLMSEAPLEAGVAKIWARRLAPGVTSADSARENEPRLERIWGFDGASMRRFADAISANAKAAIVWVQHHPGQLSNADMTMLTPAFKAHQRRLVVTLHNTREVLNAPGAEWLGGVDRLIVHTAGDAELLGARGWRAEVLPHGVMAGLTRPIAAQGAFKIGSFGFLTPHKNIELLVGALAQARQSDPTLGLVLANAVRPESESRAAAARVEALIRYFGLEDAIERDYGFLSETEVADRLAPCHVLAFLYGDSNESASGAARMGFAMDRPMLISASGVLADLRPYALMAPKLDIETIAEAVLALSRDRHARTLMDRGRRAYTRSHAWPTIAQRAAQALTFS